MGCSPGDEHRKIASYYYREHYSAAEIAARLSLPKTRVRRMLKEAVENGLVSISIPSLEGSRPALEIGLEEKLGLQEVVLAEVPEGGDPLDAVAGAANRVLGKLIRDGSVIGISHGRTVATMVSRMLPTDRWRDLTVIRLVGALGNRTLTIPSDDIVRVLADKLRAGISFPVAPVILKNPRLRKALLEEPLLREAFRLMRETNLAVLGIGGVDFSGNPMLRESLDEADYRRLTSSGAVGEICTRFFDLSGRSVTGPLDRHVIAVDEKTLLSIPVRLGVARGIEKTDAILGACRGRYINRLVTDRETGSALAERIGIPPGRENSP